MKKMEAVLQKIVQGITASRKRAVFTIKILIGIALVLFLLFYSDPESVLYVIKNANYYLVAVTVLLSFVNLLFQFLRWRLISRELLEIKNKKSVFLSLFYGLAAGLVTPARLGEHIGRALPYKGKRVTDVVVASFTDKYFTLIIILIAGSVSLFFVDHEAIRDSRYYIVSILVFITLALVFAIINRRAIYQIRIFNKILSYNFVRRVITKVKRVLGIRTRALGFSLFYSTLYYFTFILQYILLISALEHEFRFFEYFIVMNVIHFTKSFIPQFSFGELGIREGVSIFFLGFVGVSQAAALNTSLFIFVINLALPSLFGLALLFRRNNE